VVTVQKAARAAMASQGGVSYRDGDEFQKVSTLIDKMLAVHSTSLSVGP
jgi:hypothetical protein